MCSGAKDALNLCGYIVDVRTAKAEALSENSNLFVKMCK